MPHKNKPKNKTKNNIIKFPTPSKPKPDQRPTLFTQPLLNNRNILGMAIVSVLAASCWLNWQLKSQRIAVAPEQVPGQTFNLNPRVAKPQKRSLASFSPHLKSGKKLLQHQLETKNETIVGRRPSSLDNLQFGLLAGHYAFEYMQSNKTVVQKIKFVKKSSIFPVLVPDRKAFLKKYAALWPEKFDQITTLKRELMGEVLYETYNLQHKGQTVARARFELDRLEHLLHLDFRRPSF